MNLADRCGSQWNLINFFECFYESWFCALFDAVEYVFGRDACCMLI